jgi:hypothetical protein
LGSTLHAIVGAQLLSREVELGLEEGAKLELPGQEGLTQVEVSSLEGEPVSKQLACLESLVEEDLLA